MRLIIAGSRGFNDYAFLAKMIDAYICEEKNVTIISGGARGADMLGEEYARKNDLKIKRWKALWDEYGKSAGYRRNVHMAEDATDLIAFWDGKSKGTKHMIDIAKDRGLSVTVFAV